jgi:hypothetical protein
VGGRRRRSLDLPGAMAVVDLVTGFALAWRDEQKEQVIAVGENGGGDAFDETPPIFYV